ncbi:MAG: tRNA 5-methoxyuridine(34)/uridine 5-oxyacetic acid(34) synthase CmoB [Candidatus Sedimenticola sp. 20ELBAFRAG]
MIDYTPLYRQIRETALDSWASELPGQLESLFSEKLHGDFPAWLDVLGSLPALPADRVELDRGAISVGADTPPAPETLKQLEQLLQRLHPWRKGPFDIHGIRIDTEWRSDWKWDRLKTHISPLAGRTVLDVGCGNGYHCWRMIGAGAKLVIGIDPTQLFLAQYMAIRHFLGEHLPVYHLPIGIEHLPANLRAFDTVFSMGVLYHRRSPIDHLMELKACLRQGGELVLETLVIEGGDGEVLVPAERYAKMRNVWFIPSPETLVSWMKRCGFYDVQIVDVTDTSTDEQRATGWMRFESLADYLDPTDPSRTVEGHPAPRRAIIVATSP